MTLAKPVAAFLGASPEALERVYPAEVRARLAAVTALRPGVHGPADRDALAGVDYLFATWGVPPLDEAAWRSLPQLKALFYAAGSVQGFARPLLAAGVRLFSAWETNAQPVADYCLALILLAGKGVLPRSRALQGQAEAWSAAGLRGGRQDTVALLGAGKVGRALLQRLRPFGRRRRLVYDPFLGADEAQALDVERVTLEQAFSRAQVLSNHLADLPATRGLINEALLSRLPVGATFINTGRGGTVDEDGLWRVLAARPDLTAVLDVLQQEPPAPGHPALSLPNVFLTPHVAGSLGDEQPALGLAMADALEAVLAGRACEAEVTAALLQWMA